MESLNNTSDYKEAIDKYGLCVVTTVGTSMLPMLKSGIDSVVIKKLDRQLHKYDCILYKRPSSGTYVLHRIIKIKDDKLVLCGDNQWQKESGITPEDIIGVMDAYYKKDKYIPISKFSYKLYYHFRVAFRWTRFIRDKSHSLLSKIKHKIFK